MKWTFASAGLVAAGMVGVVIILLFQNLTVNNEEDYYLLKEMTEAAMIDSIDLAYYRDSGKLKIIQEKFVENFTRRFSESANILNTNNYSLEFYNIMETPPKVSVSIKTDIGDYTIFGNHLDTQSYSVRNALDAIIETDEISNQEKNTDCVQTKLYYSVPYVAKTNTEYFHPGATIKPPDDSGNWEVLDYHYRGRVLENYDIVKYMEEREKQTMYEVEPQGFDSIDSEMNKYIATEQNLEYFEIDENNKLQWTATFKCLDGKKFLLSSGAYTRSDSCIIGIIYEVDWYNKSCNK